MQFTTSNSPLLQSFQIFYYELLKQKEKALRMSEPDTVFDDKGSGQQDVSLIDGIQKKMRGLLEEQAYKLSRSVGGAGATQIRDAQYLMTILTDEVFLSLSWPGTKQWQKSLLEAQIFETQIAGEAFYSQPHIKRLYFCQFKTGVLYDLLP